MVVLQYFTSIWIVRSFETKAKSSMYLFFDIFLWIFFSFFFVVRDGLINVLHVVHLLFQTSIFMYNSEFFKKQSEISNIKNFHF